jgi:hypothetical protein
MESYIVSDSSKKLWGWIPILTDMLIETDVLSSLASQVVLGGDIESLKKKANIDFDSKDIKSKLGSCNFLICVENVLRAPLKTSGFH